MAEPSARARLGQVRRNIIKRKQKVNIVSGLAEDIGAIGAFVGGKLKESKTAWDEYETGYKQKFSDQEYTPEKRGWFSKPKGEVTVGDQIYQREDIQKLGSFYQSDIGKALGDRSATFTEKMVPGKPVEAGSTSPPSLETVSTKQTLQTPAELPRSMTNMQPRRQQTGGYSQYEGQRIEPLEMNQSLGQKVASGFKSFTQGFGGEKWEEWKKQVNFRSPWERNLWNSQIENNKNRLGISQTPEEEYY